ncbi:MULTISPECIES: hypothetical protein [Escherichia]|nr:MULTISPECIES: hypothetical protein [Escherichia]MCZ9080042.1 hypothetical protein [Escherichia albertii]
MDTFHFQRMKEAFHAGIIVAATVIPPVFNRVDKWNQLSAEYAASV